MTDLHTVDLLGLIGRDTNLKRVASTNGGEYAGPCPFCGGRDRLRVQPEANGKGRWFCRQCTDGPDGGGHWLDAIDYVRRRDSLDYRQACDLLDIEGQRPQERPSPPRPTVPQTGQVAMFDQTAALAVVGECERALWDDAGAKARVWLAGRGITEETVRAWRLGYNPKRREVCGLVIPRGVVIPCFVGDAVQYIKVRRPAPPLPGPKYQQVKGGKGALFGLNHLTGKRVAVICEAELDAILLHQEAGDLVDVVALGSKGTRPALPWLAHLAGAARWLVALDRDADNAADWWGTFSGRVRRVRPLQGNDLTDFAQAGGDLRAWVIYHLEGRADTKPTPKVRPVLAVKADLVALLDQMREATGCDGAEAERLLWRWDVLNAEYSAAVAGALGL